MKSRNIVAGYSWIPIVMAMSLVAIAGLIIGCGDDDDSTGPGTAANIEQLVAYSDCGGYPETVAKAYIPETETGVVWFYDGKGTLDLQHLNAAFNCCPEATCEISVADNVITITEKEAGACDCICLVDVDCQISGLKAGTYNVKFVELYLEEGDKKLEFPVTLTGDPASDTVTVVRDHYPWVLPGPPTGGLATYSECGGFDSSRYAADPPADSNCVIFQYDVSGTLTLRHQNATFNCCIDDLVAAITVTEDVIDIVENEIATQPCFCVCPYDLDMKVFNLMAGKYTINITSPYLDEPIRVDVDLLNEPVGYLCADSTVPH